MTTIHSTRAILVAVALLAACGDDDAAPGVDAGPREMGAAGDGGLTNVMVSHPAAAPIPPATECTVTTSEAASPPMQQHVPSCSELTLDVMPPVGGPHYPIWAAYQVYDAPVPWGFLMHAMEHGGVVLAYDCPSGCPDVLAELTAIAAEVEDSDCAAGENRMIVVPVPSLGVPVAAVAWGHQYVATCLDGASLRAFVTANYAHGPEDLCAQGSVVTTFCDVDGGPRDAGPHDGGDPGGTRPDAATPSDAAVPMDGSTGARDGDLPGSG